MRRILKFLFNLVLAFLAVGITLVVIFFFNAGWQQSMVERLMAADPQRQWQVESVRLGPTEVSLGGLFVLDSAVGAEVDTVLLKGPFWSSPLRQEVKVSSGLLSGLFLDLSEVKIGDLTSRDWQEFVQRVAKDEAFWEERVDLVLSKLAVGGWDIRLEDVEIRGETLLPGGMMVPLEWRIIEAGSAEDAAVDLEPLAGEDVDEGQLL